MKLQYNGKMAGIIVGPHKLPKGEEVEIDDPVMAEMIQGIAGVEKVLEAPPTKGKGKSKSTAKEEAPETEGATLEDETTTEKDS